MRRYFGLLLLFTTCQAISQNMSGFIDSVRKQYGIPELAYAVVIPDKVREIAVTGKHAVHINDTATLQDRFHIGSNTKAMTAFIIAKYVERGRLHWDTRFFDVFPEWKSFAQQAYWPVTLGQLLAHKGGVSPFLGSPDDPVVPAFKGTVREKRALFGKFVLGLPPLGITDSVTFHYSNAGYSLAALMLEKVTRQSWEELVNEVFNKDLKLDVQLSWPDNQKYRDTWGHTGEDQLVPVASDTAYKLDYTEPAGDLNIRLDSYVKFIQLHLQGLAGKDNYLRASTYTFMHTGYEAYALGWFNNAENGKNWSVHAGTAGTYYSLVHIDRTSNIAYIIFTNAFNSKTLSATRLIMKTMKERYGNGLP